MTLGICDGPMRLVYSGTHLDAYFHPGSTDFLLVSFNPFGFKADYGAVWAKKLIERNNISSLSILSKRSNWFPKKDIDAVANQSRVLLNYFQDRILLYGFSM